MGINRNETLAVKYRPQRLDDVVEQDIIKHILSNQLKTKKIKNAYLFVGSAGTGKTTTARIFANELNNFKGGIIEIDGASNNGVDDIREIIDSSKYQSINSEYKIFIVDECHSISSAGWQSFLKTLEEPSMKTIYILCTTDPQKIPATILSRVQRYDFQKISLNGIVGRLKYILDKEYSYYPLNDEIIQFIAKQSMGGMRDAISLMEKCLGYLTPDKRYLTIEEVIDILGTVDYETMFNLFRCLIYEGIEEKELFNIIEGIFNAGKDLKLFIKNFLSYILDILKYYYTKDLNNTLIPPTATWKERLTNICNQDDTMIKDIKFILKDILTLNNAIKFQPAVKPIVESDLLLLKSEVAK